MTKLARETRTRARRIARGERPNRPQALAETLKGWIVDNDMGPGDRLPQEQELISMLRASKGTVREALRVLETQGLIRTRTGPGGGAFVTSVGDARMEALLYNLVFCRAASLEDLMDLREALAPMQAAELARGLSAEAAETLALRLQDRPSGGGEPDGREMGDDALSRALDVELHEALCQATRNPLLRFLCGFVIRTLRERAQVGAPLALGDATCGALAELKACRRNLVDALRRGDPEAARDLASRHAALAREILRARRVTLAGGFLDMPAGA